MYNMNEKYHVYGEKVQQYSVKLILRITPGLPQKYTV